MRHASLEILVIVLCFLLTAEYAVGQETIDDVPAPPPDAQKYPDPPSVDDQSAEVIDNDQVEPTEVTDDEAGVDELAYPKTPRHLMPSRGSCRR